MPEIDFRSLTVREAKLGGGLFADIPAFLRASTKRAPVPHPHWWRAGWVRLFGRCCVPTAPSFFMAGGVVVDERNPGDAHIARAVLEALPDWFGQAAAREAYIRASARLPMLIASTSAGPVGFLSLLTHTARHAEIHVMGVHPAHRRNGHGAALIQAATTWCRKRRTNLLTVRTLASTAPDPSYAETRAFYRAMGFALSEVLPDLWGPGVPCAVYRLGVNVKRR